MTMLRHDFDTETTRKVGPQSYMSRHTRPDPNLHMMPTSAPPSLTTWKRKENFIDYWHEPKNFVEIVNTNSL